MMIDFKFDALYRYVSTYSLDRSNYSPLLPHPLPHSRSIQTFTKPLRWGLILHCCSTLLQNLVRNSGEMQCLEEAEQQAEASIDVYYPPLQIVKSVPFCLFSLYLYPLSAPFLNPLSSPSSPSLLSLLINCLSS